MGTMQSEFDEIYRLYAADIYRYLLRLTRNETLAADLLQDTMLKAFTSIDRFRGNCAVKTWLCTITRNLWCDHCKKAENRNLPLEAAGEIPDSGSFEQRLADQSQAMQIHTLLHRMKEPYKEVFSLRVFAELNFREIGKVFGKTENWARTTFYRAKHMLIGMLEQEDAYETE